MSMSNNTDLIFENYERFLTENENDIGSPSAAIEMIASDGAFHSYVNSLTEGLDANVKTNVLAVCERQREMLLEESVNIGATASAIGYAVSYFPILTDIYSDPILNKVATIYPTSKSMITLPKSVVKASVKNIDGTTDTYTIPRSTLLARQKKLVITMLPNTSNDMFALAGGLNPEEVRVNKRYFIVTNLVVAKGGVNTIVPLLIRPDARGQLNKDFSYDDAGVIITGKLIGNVDWDRGRVQYSVTYSDNAVTTVSIDSDTIFSARTSDIGRVKVSVEMSGFDVNIDVKDDFEIELETETVQDYKDIYNIDLVRTLSQAIKQQVMLNKDFDLAYYLQAYEAEMSVNGASRVVDFDILRDTNGTISPNSVVNIFQSIVPFISSVSRQIRSNYRADPQYLLAGMKTASVLESLQHYYAKFGDNNNGEVGSTGTSAGGFRNQTVLSSDALPENKIYVVYKAPSDALERSTIVDLIYKPLYIIEEVTNSVKRTYVKSRTALEFVRSESMGVIEVRNYDRYLG